MEVILLDSTLEKVGVIDVFHSLLWVDRYDSFGDFEIVESPTSNILYKFAQSTYMTLKESDHAMIIESINIRTDLVDGNKLIIKGRSLESILDRRIVWGAVELTGDFQDNIQALLNDNAIDPVDTDRTISLLEFSASTDPAITNLTIDSQFVGNTLYEVITNVCMAAGVGFKITLTSLGKFQFKLYAGADRSYNQSTNPYVVFSPKYDNLINADYLLTNQHLKTIALVGGENGVGNVRIMVPIASPGGAGTELSRREMFVDAQGVTRNTPDVPLTEAEYIDLLEQKGLEDLAKNIIIQSFDGEAQIDGTYTYGEDFFMGDILQIANEYGHQATSRVIEMIFSQDPASISKIPKFMSV